MRRHHSPKNATKRLKFESLEARRCLAADVTNLGNFNETDPYLLVGNITLVDDDIYFVDGGQLFIKHANADTAIALSENLQIGRDTQFTVFDGNLYFQGFDETNGYELWRSDGTAAGTGVLKVLSSNNVGSYVRSPTVFNNRLYFTSDGNLFSTDGTADGTTQLVDIVPSTADGVANLTVHNGSLYFSAQSSLYKSDGTGSGTNQLAGSPTGTFALLTSTPGSLYFNANNLWRLDDATQQFQIIGPQASSIAAVSGSLYFSSGSSLWKTNATATGSEEIAYPGGQIGNLINLQGTLFFSGGQEREGAGNELWRSDGTTAGTFMVKDIEPRQWSYFGELISYGSYPSRFSVFNNQLYFVTDSNANAPDTVTGFWKTDGTAAGTVQVQPGIIFGSSQNDAYIYFGAPTDAGFKLLRLDATGQITEVPRDGTGTGSFAGNNGATVNGKQILFGSTGTLGNELYQLNSDNTFTLIKDLSPGQASTAVQRSELVNNLLYFVGAGSLYRTDGTAAGTFALMPFNRLDAIKAVGNQVFIAGEQSGTGSELWKTDGTVAGTVLVKDIGGVDASSNPLELTEFNSKLYFTAIAAGKRTVWESDGTAAGTKMAVNLAMLESNWLRVSNNQLYWSTSVGSSYRIYRSNGTQSGTTALAATFQNIGDPNQVAVLGNTLFFAGRTPTYGYEVWKIVGNGTPQLVKDIVPGVNWSSPTDFSVFNDKLYFTAFSPNMGRELWESSGTATTTRVLEINPGGEGSYPSMLGELGGVMFLAATDQAHGRELWQLNTSSGVSLVKDILPGARGSDPGSMIIRGQDAVFSANTFPLGRELWSVRSAPPTMTLPAQAATDYREAAAPVRLAPQALLDDSDNSNFIGGRLSISLGATFRAGDQVLIANSSTVSLSATNVLVSGAVVGTLTTSGGGRDLKVDFTRSATRAQVREVLRAVAFNHTTASPVPGLRTVSFTLTDGSSGLSSRNVRINVVPLDTLPVISGLSGSVNSTLNSAGFAFAASAIVSDDNFNLAGGELTVHFNNSRDATRILISLGGPMFWKDASNNVYKGSVVIGTMNAGGGVGLTPLRITFNEKVTPALAQELLRTLKLSTPGSTTTGVRIPWIRISDGSRGFSEPLTRPYVSINS